VLRALVFLLSVGEMIPMSSRTLRVTPGGISAVTWVTNDRSDEREVSRRACATGSLPSSQPFGARSHRPWSDSRHAAVLGVIHAVLYVNGPSTRGSSSHRSSRAYLVLNDDVAVSLAAEKFLGSVFDPAPPRSSSSRHHLREPRRHIEVHAAHRRPRSPAVTDRSSSRPRCRLRRSFRRPSRGRCEAPVRPCRASRRPAPLLRRGRRRVSTDGPYAETREILGGFYLLDVSDLDAALDWAARCPGSHHGGRIEVRPRSRATTSDAWAGAGSGVSGVEAVFREDRGRLLAMIGLPAGRSGSRRGVVSEASSRPGSWPVDGVPDIAAGCRHHARPQASTACRRDRRRARTRRRWGEPC